jgi:hypothetical protein
MKKPWPSVFVQRRPVARDRQTIPPLRQVVPYASTRAVGLNTESLTQPITVRPARVRKYVWPQSKSQVAGFGGNGLKPLAMSQRSCRAKYPQRMFFDGVRKNSSGRAAIPWAATAHAATAAAAAAALRRTVVTGESYGGVCQIRNDFST